MRTVISLAMLALVACTSAEEKERRKQEAMIEAAKEDAAAESTFVADSIAVVQSITVDTAAMLTSTVVETVGDDGYPLRNLQYLAISPSRTRCLLDSARYVTLVQGDTLSCQWSAPE
jgi:hypothetical protein